LAKELYAIRLTSPIEGLKWLRDDAFQPSGGKIFFVNRFRPTNKIDTPSACSGEPHLQRIAVCMFLGANGLI
ncbi:hypothetical protein P4E94_16620, partial [Pontiellaceae bacterium B12219]|nr:hypothetical protein [Pontiellaceae bacterium B12219]